MKTLALLAAAVIALTTSANALSNEDLELSTAAGSAAGFASLCEDAGINQYGQAYLFARSFEANTSPQAYKAFSSAYKLARDGSVMYGATVYSTDDHTFHVVTDIDCPTARRYIGIAMGAVVAQ